MPTNLHTSGKQESAASRYEESDANAKWIFGVVAFLVLCGFVMHFCLERFTAGQQTKITAFTTRPRIELGAAPEQTPYPRLQISPPLDLQEFRAREEIELNTYGWIDRTAGVVRIPIDRAMDLVLQRGFPVRTSTNESHAGPSSYDLQLQRAKPIEPGKGAPK